MYMVNVYLISSETNGKYVYKIGHTKRDVEKRISEFRTGNSSVFEVIDVFNSKWGTKIEAHLHRHFRVKRVGGEWFDLEEHDLLDFRRLCQQIHDNLNTIEENNTYYIDRGERF
jgi:hypothetical protein